MEDKTKQHYKSTTHEERFMHIRFPDLHYDRFVGATVFARKEDDGIWYGAVTLCSIKDQFNRKEGRNWARRRYFNGWKAELTRSEKIDFKGLRDAILIARSRVTDDEFEHLVLHTPFETLQNQA